MLIDAFTFFNELDLLEDRLEYLYPYVDYFVIGECNLTHSGASKPLYFRENEQRFRKYQDKILHVCYELDPNQQYNSWYIEIGQRNHLFTAVSHLDDDSVLMITDVDEIPNVDTFNEIQEKLKSKLIVHMGFDLFYYNLKCKFDNKIWWHPAAGKKKDVEHYTANEFRCTLADRMVDDREWVINGGWHLSFFTSPDEMVNKLKNFAHTELSDGEWTNVERIKEFMKKKENFCFHHGDHTKLITPPVEYFPHHFWRVFGKHYRD